MRHTAVDASQYWDFQPKDKVTTTEGYPGVVEAVLDGPGPGNELYEVLLDDGQGGGRYSSSELRPRLAVVRSQDKTAAVASESYPELADLLDLKPPPQHTVALSDYLAGLLTGSDMLYLTATDGGDHDDSAMVALAIPPQVAEQSAVNGGIPAEQMHVTLAYLPNPDEAQMAAAHEVTANHAGMMGPIQSSVGGLGQFPAGEDGVPYYGPIEDPSDAINALQASLVTALESAGVEVGHDHGFTPHMTLTYLPEGEEPPEPLPTTPFTFRDLVVAQGDDWTHYPLGGRDDTTEAIEDLQDLHGDKAASRKTADGLFSDLFHSRPGPSVNYDWCKFRRDTHCHFPKTLNVGRTLATGQADWDLVDRGWCGRSWDQQALCPVGEPSNNAYQLAATRKAAVVGDSGSSGITFHVLPTDPHQAASILYAEVADARSPVEQDADEPDTHEAMAPPAALMDSIHKNGGFTVKDHVGDGPSGGYMVSMNKATERAYSDTGFTAADIDAYLQQHGAELAAPNAYFGAWHDPETKKVYLDISHHFDSFEQAKDAGRSADQLAVYDLGSNKTIYLQAGLRKGFFAPSADPEDVLDFLGIET